MKKNRTNKSDRLKKYVDTMVLSSFKRRGILVRKDISIMSNECLTNLIKG